ncbi:WD40/YVTN/BNR-like repeat-containing protein [Massilia aquatica]|uniref:Exo-alpha-sialidase n=1 Tax=Massilia aquatica TaxID=2609000 RepID=A0ABX0MG71_9BURK|nr:hypothetical protein [Massilia aquatica]NHZ43915.1 hypothetical protein [Massilia aquatica]
MQITESQYAEYFEGYTISDCAVRSNDIFCFILRNIAEAEDAGPTAEAYVTKRLVSYYPYDPIDKQLGKTIFNRYENLTVCASKNGEDKAVVTSSDGLVLTAGGNESGKEEPIPTHHETGPRRGAIFRTRLIQGVMHAVGSGHTVCIRAGKNRWESISHHLPAETLADFEDEERSGNMDLEDIDGFSTHDLYAVAGKGCVWHFDGVKWRPLPFPSTMYLHSVCCAGDGYVYVGAQSGNIFRGRQNEWKQIVRESMTLPFRDIVWHADKLWLSSDYGLWNISNDKLVAAEFPSSDVAVCAGNLSVNDGVLLMAGTNGAAIHDGKSWQLIFNTMQFA